MARVIYDPDGPATVRRDAWSGKRWRGGRGVTRFGWDNRPRRVWAPLARALHEEAARRLAQLPPPSLEPIVCPDPIEFCTRYLGFTPWGKQAAWMRAVAAQINAGVPTRTAVRSGHKTGKSRGGAALALWFWATRPGARVVLTAPTGRQVRKVLWREVRQLHREAGRRGHALGGKLSKTPDTGLVSDDDRELFGFATDEPERFAGISGPNVLYIVDEASGVAEEIFEAIEGNRAGGAHVLCLGNPTQIGGTFYDAFHAACAGWQLFHVSSIEAARWQADRGAVPGLATTAWIEEKRADGWEGTPLWDVRVLGDFPRTGDNQVIPLVLIEAAIERWRAWVAEGRPEPAGALQLGVDVARFGSDASALAPVRGRHAYPIASHRGLDGPQLAARVVERAQEPTLRRRGERPIANVDVIGVGASCFDALVREKDEQGQPAVIAVAINVAENATAQPGPWEPGYHRLRDQLWFSLRTWLSEGGVLPPDPKLEAQLSAITYRFDEQGRYLVESKDDLKERLGRSPDEADALCLAVYRPPAVYAGDVSPTADWMGDR